MNLLEIRELRKSFGSHKVLDGLNLSIPEHSVFGFVGQNGAGKTTTMKMVLGLLRPDGGEIHVCGEPVTYGETRTNRCVGYLPDVPEFYGYMTPMEYLRLCGEITGMASDAIAHRSRELLELVGLPVNRRRIAGFSRGMKQRLGVAQALLNEPRLLICDEPTSALDPLGRKELLDLLSTVRGKTTVVFSTHILSDVERICDRVAVLHQGSIALEGTLDEIREKHRDNRFLLEFSSEEERSRFAEAAQKASLSVEDSDASDRSLKIRAEDPRRTGQQLLHLLTELGITPIRFEAMEPTLESLFLEVVQ